MLSDLLDSWSLLAIIAEDLEDEVFEVIREFGSANFLPILFELPVHDQIIEVLVFFGLLEGEDALNDDEEDHTSGEHVDLLAVVHLALLDLWGHVGHGTSV